MDPIEVTPGVVAVRIPVVGVVPGMGNPKQCFALHKRSLNLSSLWALFEGLKFRHPFHRFSLAMHVYRVNLPGTETPAL